MFSERTWVGIIAALGIAIAVVAGWTCFAYGDVLDQITQRPDVKLLILGVFLLLLLGILLRGLVYLVRRWRKSDRPPAAYNRWSFAWVSFQLACMLALIVLGAAALAAIPLGYAGVMFDAFMLVLVASGLLFITGGAVRDMARFARSFR